MSSMHTYLIRLHPLLLLCNARKHRNLRTRQAANSATPLRTKVCGAWPNCGAAVPVTAPWVLRVDHATPLPRAADGIPVCGWC